MKSPSVAPDFLKIPSQRKNKFAAADFRMKAAAWRRFTEA
jgi:hypothetical protein